jgi:3-oxoacyl-[acyl-carrier-protein] synthase III
MSRKKKRRSVEWKFTSSPSCRRKARHAAFQPQKRDVAECFAAASPADRRRNCREIIFRIARRRVKREQIAGWILHTGGRDVILSMRDKLKLTESDVRHSAAVLREFGNISSPTVYFVLEAR